MCTDLDSEDRQCSCVRSLQQGNLPRNPQMMAESQQSAWPSKEGSDTHLYSLTHQGPLVISHSPQGHHTALPGANSNTDLVKLQRVA